MSMSQDVVAKAQRLVEEHRVLHVDADFVRSAWRAINMDGADGLRGQLAVVAGDSDTYLVQAKQSGVECSCPARGACSHILAAMMTWAES